MTGLFIKNIPNFIVLIRVTLLFPIIILFYLDSFICRSIGLALLVAVILFDWLDGYVARRFNNASVMGGILDTLGDRITENILFIFFAGMGLVPLAVPLIFVTRSFLSDFIRQLYHRRDISTFLIHNSQAGKLLVASPFSRGLYLFSKMFVFFLGGIILMAEVSGGSSQTGIGFFMPALKTLIMKSSLFVVAFNLLRFSLLVYDARFVLKEEFCE